MTKTFTQSSKSIRIGAIVEVNTGEGVGYVVGRDAHKANSWFVQFGYYTSQFSLQRNQLTIVEA